MKKVLVGIAFFIILAMFKTAKTVQAATTDLSKNFTALHVNARHNMSVFNDEFVHVQVDFNDQQYPIKGNSSMRISWKNSDAVFIQGIPEKRKLIAEDDQGKEYEVGQYTVAKDGVLVTFNENIEDFKEIAGNIDFDLQIKNLTKNGQNLFIQAGDLSKKLHVIGQLRPEPIAILAEISGDYDKQQDEISWEIKIDPQKEEKGTIKVSNDIPSGLLLDDKSVEAEIDNKKVKLNKDNAELTKDNLKLYFDNKNYLGHPITVRYKTKVINENAIEALNQITVGYLKDGKITNESIYGGKIQNGNNKCITAAVLDLESSKEGQKVRNRGSERKETAESKKDRYLKLYHEVMDLLFKRKSDNKNNVENELKNADKSKSLSLPNTSSAFRLTGFDNTPTPLAETSVAKANKVKDTVKVLDEGADQDKKLNKADIKENIKPVHHAAGHSSNKLPRAGEDTSIVLAVIGSIILGTELVAFKLRLKK